MSTAAVIDIGSNTIKVLVASKTDSVSTPILLKTKTIEARISKGISRTNPMLTSEAMQRGLSAVKDLLQEASVFNPTHILLVATSAVRDAQNGADFRDLILKETGHPVHILTGDEEATGIGQGLLCDPNLKDLTHFMVFDLGGGSLECLNFVDRKITHQVSLPLGCVRLTELFVKDSTIAFNAHKAVHDHVVNTVQVSGFRFNPQSVAIGTGGTLTTARLILASKEGKTLDNYSPRISLTQLKTLHQELSGLSLKDRLSTPGLPQGRADVFPVALQTLISLAELGKFETYHHSLFNLRWGLVAKLLA
jgi:exopolyphosphatase/guanosine-5'-triphosphate,3'-diphosphate pyrophosphatase